MFTKLALNPRLSRETVGKIYRYLFNFGDGANRVFWVGDHAFGATDNPSDISLLRDRFPDMAMAEIDDTPHDFPW